MTTHFKATGGAAGKPATKIQRSAPDKLPEPAVPVFAFNMDQISLALGCSVPTAYKLVTEGHLTTFLVGRRRYASVRAIHNCVDRLEKLGAVLPWQSGGNNRAVTANASAPQREAP